MKTKRFLVFGLPVVLLALGLAMCDVGGDPGSGTLTSFLSGFLSVGGHTVYFNLQDDDDSSLLSASAKGVSINKSEGLDDGYDLTGVLEDGPVLARLRGSYDPETGNWAVSARSAEDVVYTFEGRVDSTGEFRDANATIVEPSSTETDEWAPVFAPVTRATPWDLREPEESTASGMPPFAFGYWSGSLHTGVTDGETEQEVLIPLGCLISDWKVKVTNNGEADWSVMSTYNTLVDQNQTIIKVENKENGTYEVISCYPYYKPDENYAKAVAAWLGLNENDVKFYTSYPDRGDAGDRWVWIDPQAVGPPLCILPTDEFEKLLEFYSAKGWERWAEENNVTSTRKYAKYKFVFSDENKTFDMIQMIKGGGEDGVLSSDALDNTYIFDTLSDLNEADLKEEHTFGTEEESEEVTDLGVLKRTFTRIR
jgi:hypothetical protein